MHDVGTNDIREFQRTQHRVLAHDVGLSLELARDAHRRVRTQSVFIARETWPGDQVLQLRGELRICFAIPGRVVAGVLRFSAEAGGHESAAPTDLPVKFTGAHSVIVGEALSLGHGRAEVVAVHERTTFADCFNSQVPSAENAVGNRVSPQPSAL